MARRLTAHERALWSRVAATVRPLPGRAVALPHPLPSPAPTPTPAPAPVTVAAPVVRAAPARPARAAAVRPPAPVPVTAATLDGSWDRRLRQGDVTPDRVIDLHGHTLAAAHDVLAAALEGGRGERIILVITGKGRSDRPGRIRAELAHWLEGSRFRGRIAALRPAHQRHGGAGAFYLILRRAG